MLDIEDPDIEGEKCYTTIGKLPAFVDPEHPPTKKAPFSAIRGHPFVHNAELILPEEIYDCVWDSVSSKLSASQYARVIMPLSALLEHDFFNTYIKIGDYPTCDVLMISEGRSGVDNIYSLRDGVLRLELDKVSYERAGLVGKPVRSGGRKHVKTRYIVEINLRLPSMLHGKKGFERIVWAFKNLLNSSVTWLFCDLTSGSDIQAEGSPLKQHHPRTIPCTPVKTNLGDILVPPLNTIQPNSSDSGKDFLRESCEEAQEWLGLVSLASPRVRADDSIDPYLSRYSVPNRDNCEKMNLVKATWQGLLPTKWVMQLFIATHRNCASRSSNQRAWFSLTCFALGRDVVDARIGYTILALPSCAKKKGSGELQESSTEGSQLRQFVCWEYAGGTSWGT